MRDILVALGAGVAGLCIVAIAKALTAAPVRVARRFHDDYRRELEARMRLEAADLSRDPQGRLALTLMERRDDIAGIVPADNSEQWLREAMAFLEIQQTLVIQTLRENAAHWKSAPAGWRECTAPPLHAWSALVVVLKSRYPSDLVHRTYLYNNVRRISPTEIVLEITPQNFRQVKWASAQCVGLVIRELTHPHWERQPDPDAIYPNAVANSTRLSQPFATDVPGSPASLVAARDVAALLSVAGPGAAGSLNSGSSASR